MSLPHPAHRIAPPSRFAKGFSLVELMIGLVIFALLAGTVVTILVVSSAQKTATGSEVGNTQMARVAIQMLSRDLRTAGYGADITYTTPQPPVAYIDSMQVLINSDQQPFPDTTQATRGIPLAYKPTGNPRPRPLDGTAWQPAIRYRTGAETIRWTLDLNNDGTVNASDLAADDGADARRTANPNDYEMVREVWGDSTNGAAGNNGGKRERVAMIKQPGGATPPLFTVYLAGDAGPWDWSKGPIPANRLAEIEHIDVTVVATSPTKNFMGQYAETRLSSSVSELRNAPNFQWINYTVSGYVYNDANKNRKKDGAEVGIAGVNLYLSGYLSAVTGATGFYTFSAPPGTYQLTQSVPENYGIYSDPDSVAITIGPNASVDFADTLRTGGWCTLTVYNDVDVSKSFNGGDIPMPDIPVALVGTDIVRSTDDNGQVLIFLPVGTSKLSASLPDSFFFSTANPVSVAMTNGATKTAAIGMYLKDYGIAAGTVYNDDNGNNVMDSGEKGVPWATVSCTLPDSTVVYDETDGKGIYGLKLPVNDPPHTTPYTLTCQPPAGYAGTAPPITGLYVKNKQTVASKNFPLGAFTVWQHDVDDPLSAINYTDFIEHDWRGTGNGNSKHAVHDQDLIVGSAKTETSELQQWFNNYDDNPPFHNLKSTTRTAPQSVISLACDTLDAKSSDGFCRPDAIVGTRYNGSTNWHIWFTQNTSGNEGFLDLQKDQSYTTYDKGDVQSILTYSAGAGLAPNILIGTRSPSFGQGSIELWTSASHTNPAYVRVQLIPPTGLVPGNNLGEVAAMALGDMNGDGVADLVVGTLTGFYSGQVMVFKSVAGVWTYQWKATLGNDAVSALTLTDVNADGKLDIVVGTTSGLTSGNLVYYKNKGNFTFENPVAKAAQGAITCLGHADYDGDGIDDIVVGWRDSELTWRGGLEFWYTTAKALPNSGFDPTGGKVNKWVACFVVADFNYGVWPKPPSDDPVPDIIAIIRRDQKRGTLYELIR